MLDDKAGNVSGPKAGAQWNIIFKRNEHRKDHRFLALPKINPLHKR